MKHIDHRIALAIIVLGGFALRLVRLDFQPLWWDEGYSLFFATRDFATMLARTAVDIHPPLYYALLQFWIAFAGKSETAVRLLSVAIGVAAIPLLYILTIKLFVNRRIALIAALILALSPLHIYYSQEVRMYGLVTLLGLGSVYLFATLLDMPPGKPKTAIVALAYILVTIAALYTQYYAGFVVAFEILFFGALVFRHSPLVTPNSIAHWLAAWLAIAALYLPWVVYAGGKLYVYVTAKKAIEQYSPLDPITYLAQHLAAFSVGHLTDWTWLAWGSVVLVALAITGAYSSVSLRRAILSDPERSEGKSKDATKQSPPSHTEIASQKSPAITRLNDVRLRPRSSTSLLLVSLYLLVPLALGYIVNLIYPFHPVRNERLLLLAMPAFVMLVARGIDVLWRRRAWLGALALVTSAMLSTASLYDFYTVPRYPNDDYRPLISQLQQSALPGDTFLVMYPWQIGYLESYYTGAPLDVLETPSDAWINDPAQMQHDLDLRLAKEPRVWLPALQTQGHILEDALDALLRPRAYSVVDTWFGTTRLELFQRADDPPRAPRSIQFKLGGGMFTFDDWGVSVNPVAAGQDLVRLWLDNRNPSAGTLKASFRLVDANGNVWAQDDRELSGGMQRIGFAVPIGTPPNDYALRAALYHDQSTSSQMETLATVHVVAPARPNLAAVPNQQTIEMGRIQLIGYDAPPSVQPGEPTTVALFWQASRALTTNYVVQLQVQDDRGNVYASAQAAPAFGIYPTSLWQPNELVRDPQTIMLRGDTPDGDYNLVASLIDPAQLSPSQARVVGTITVKNRPHYFGASAPSQTLNARFGDVARLVGYDVNSDARSTRLVLYWQALALTPTSYTVFVHAVDANGNAVAYGDAVPGNGSLPTTSWVKDEYLADLHEFSIPPGAPPGDYQIQIGLYDPKTSARLSLFDASDKNSGDYIQLPTRITIN